MLKFHFCCSQDKGNLIPLYSSTRIEMLFHLIVQLGGYELADSDQGGDTQKASSPTPLWCSEPEILETFMETLFSLTKNSQRMYVFSAIAQFPNSGK